MKQFIIMLLIVAMCLSLVACGKSEEIKNVESLISAIGAVSENSESAIVAAESAYNALSSDDKNKIGNYNTLLDARKAYDAIPKEIRLTADNFRDYFNVSCSYGELETHKSLGISFAYVETIVDVYQVASGSLDNVSIKLNIKTPSGWGLSSEDSAYSSSKNDGEEFTITINMPASGEYSETHRIGKAVASSKPSANCTIEIVSVSGTFTEGK